MRTLKTPRNGYSRIRNHQVEVAERKDNNRYRKDMGDVRESNLCGRSVIKGSDTLYIEWIYEPFLNYTKEYFEKHQEN